MTQSDGINSDKTSLPANDQNQPDENKNDQNKKNSDSINPGESKQSALKGNYRSPSKKAGKEQPIKKTGAHENEEGKQLGDETEITDETTI